MLDSSTRDQFVELTRARLADGSSHDALLGDLRRQGLEKLDRVRVLAAAGMSLGQAKGVVHDSPVWADRREADEHFQDMFARALFIDCLVGNGQPAGDDPAVAECGERQARATSLLRHSPQV